MNVNALDKLTMPLLASFMGRRYGIKVVIDAKAETASTNGKVITLPLLDDTPESKLFVKGYLDHEAAHVRFTPFNELAKWGEEGMTPIEHHIWNVFEDVRVERLLVKQMPGCFPHLVAVRKMASHKKKEMREVMESLFKCPTSLSPTDEFLSYLLEATRFAFMPEGLDGIFFYKGTYDKKYPSLAEEVSHVIARVLKAETFQDVKECTKAIMDILKNQEKPQDTPQSQSGEEQKEQSRDDSPSQDGASSQGDSSSQDQSQDNSRSSSGRSEASQSDDKLNSPSSSSNDDADGASGCEANIKKSILDSQDSSSFEQQARDVLQAICEEHQIDPKSVLSKFNSFQELNEMDSWIKFDQGKKIDTSTTPADVLRLKSKLKQLLQADSFEKKKPSYSGKLSTRKLYQARTGNTRLFHSAERVKKEDTAIHILLDNSGSMNSYGRIELANSSMLAITHALKSEHRFNLGITAFGEYVYPLLRHGEKVHDRVGVEAFGGTNIHKGLAWAMSELMFLREKRKVLIVLTDGDMGSNILFENTLHQLSVLGIEVIALGIQVGKNSLDIISAHNVSIQSIGELPQAMFSLLKGLSL